MRRWRSARPVRRVVGAECLLIRKEWMLAMFLAHARRSAQNSENMVWQKTNHPELLYSDAFFEQKAEYIRNNPVQMGLVTEPQHYAWSSAHPDAIIKPDDE